MTFVAANTNLVIVLQNLYTLRTVDASNAVGINRQNDKKKNEKDKNVLKDAQGLILLLINKAK